MPEAVLPIIISEVQARTVVEATIVLPEEVLRVETANTQVQIDRCRVNNNSVFIAGRVIINIPFKTGTIDDTGTGLGMTRTVCGDLRHCTAFIPFTVLTDVPGAQEGDQCRIIRACVRDLFIDRPDNNNDNADDTGNDHDRLNVAAEVCIRLQVTRDQVVDVLGTVQPTTRFVTFPSFR
ncbi:MAG TPA: SPOCS domain-containing protein [Symbiobacteriaceae bacterium]|nr:SPOCS domain-containing protein [Symbiobacteriaceae bacterium]